MSRKHMPKAWLLCCVVGFAPAAHAEPLSFADAINRAAIDGPTIAARDAAVEAAERSIGPAGRLPDPELVLALDNVPVTGADRFRLNRDDMTMRRVGVMQDVPSRAERRARTAMAEAEAQRARAGLEIARLEARLGAAQAWISLYYSQRRLDVFNQIALEARTSAEAARARLAAGGAGVGDAITAEIEAARIEDRRADAGAMAIAARAELRRWIGEAANEMLAAEAPSFDIEPERLGAHLPHHPALEAFQAEDALANANVRMARAETRPDWSWELAYGRRDPSFGDMASVEVRVGLPLFQGGRQRPIIAARQADVARVGAERTAVEREHAAMLEARLAEHDAVSANFARARNVRLPLAQRRASAVSGAFSAGTTSVDQLVAARRDALEAELNVIDLEERRAALGAALTLQYAEPSQ